MDDDATRIPVGKLILVPALISLAVTMLRLAGELRGWSPVWFSKDTGGVIPSGMSWVIGITWLAIPFGAYFGWKLEQAGRVSERDGNDYGFLGGDAGAGTAFLENGSPKEVSVPM